MLNVQKVKYTDCWVWITACSALTASAGELLPDCCFNNFTEAKQEVCTTVGNSVPKPAGEARLSSAGERVVTRGDMVRDALVPRTPGHAPLGGFCGASVKLPLWQGWGQELHYSKVHEYIFKPDSFEFRRKKITCLQLSLCLEVLLPCW